MITKIAVNVDREIVRYSFVRRYISISIFSNVIKYRKLERETF